MPYWHRTSQQPSVPQPARPRGRREVLGDSGYRGADSTVRAPYRGHWDKLSAAQRAVKVSHAKIRALGEQTMAILKS